MTQAEMSTRILIVTARFYDDIADELEKGAILALQEAGATYEVIAVPGAFEIPAAVAMAACAGDAEPKRWRFHGVVALGCVIRGETTHYDYVCQESARGLQRLAVELCLPLGYGILTCENRQQAWDRAAVDRRNKGGDVARACLDMVALKRRLGLLTQP